MRSISTSKLNTSTSSSITALHYSPWHSPIPYLFGGLAAIMCLIAFALLMLACSYWRLYGNQHGDQRRDLENKEGDPEKKEPIKVHEEKILVIMAGDENPTFLATPVCSKSSSFVHDVGNNFDQNLGNRDKHLVLVPAADTTTQQENNQDSQQEQRSQ